MAIDPECGRRFEEMHTLLVGIDEAIRGNGKPGLNLRVDRCEQQNASVSKWKWIVIALATAALFKATF